MAQLPFAKYDAEFRKDHPETIGETDQSFDLDNYCEWLEKRVADRDRLASDIQATRAELEETRHDLAKFQRSERVLAEMLREKMVELERVRRSQLRRMRREALEWADRMTWSVPSKENVGWVRRNRPRLMRFAERCRTALATMETGRG